MSSSTFTPYTGRRVALVTGSAQGIGRGIALRLAADGYSVALGDIPSKAEALEALSAEIYGKEASAKDSHPDWEPRKVAVLCVDVRDESSVKEMVEKCVAELGRLDIVRLVSSVVLSLLALCSFQNEMLASSDLSNMRPSH